MGTNILVGKDARRLISELGRVLDRPGKQGGIPPLWDGHAAERIARVIVRDESRMAKLETPDFCRIYEGPAQEETDRQNPSS